MKILPKDSRIFQTEHSELKDALEQLKEDEMLAIPVVSGELKVVRSSVASFAKKYELKINTKYDKEKELLYVAIDDTKLRDINIAIEALSKYPEMNDIVYNITEKKYELYKRSGISEHS